MFKTDIYRISYRCKRVKFVQYDKEKVMIKFLMATYLHNRSFLNIKNRDAFILL